MRSHPRWSALTVLAFLVAAPAPGQTDRTPAPEVESITAADLRADLFFLASDGMQGRLSETPENRLAAEFVASRFARAGLEPPGGSFFHEYRLAHAALGNGNRLEVVGEVVRTVQLREGFYPQRFSPSAEAEGALAFAGFGIQAPAYGWDDWEDADLSGRIALILDHEPGEADPASLFDGLVTSEASRAFRKAVAAAGAGAAGVLFVRDIHQHPGDFDFAASAASAWPDPPRRVPRITLAAWVESVEIPAAVISPRVAETLLAGSGHSLASLGAMADAGMSAPLVLDTRVRLATAVTRTTTPDRNVVGLMRGAEAPDEWIILCAHYDHDGADGNLVWPGADDDGSGTVALIEIAEALGRAAARGERPRRSILLAGWNSEERGLLGAWAYTLNPLNPLDRTVAVLNMDMIGRNEEVRRGGGRRFRGLEPQTAESNANAVNILGHSYSRTMTELVRAANREAELDLKMRYDNNESNLLRRSDQWPFLQTGVPALFFHTGLHPDYHTIYDRPEKIEYEKLERIVRLVYQLAWDLADSDVRPDFTGPNRGPALPAATGPGR
ncbi:MAG: M28 family peptidase [Acidobacteriota bacterium]|nr:M28 family peptidase [Acidobacteriota bacterium]